MHRTSAHRLGLVLALGAALLFACDDGARDDTPADAAVSGDATDPGAYEFPCFDLPPPTGEATFLAVYREIFCASGCANLYCHSSRGASSGLSFETPDIAYDNLVGAPAGPAPSAGDPGCSESPLLRVEPGHPERSLLYLKVSQDPPPCGSTMPIDRAPLGADKLTQLRAWIESGAVRDGASIHDAGH